MSAHRFASIDDQHLAQRLAELVRVPSLTGLERGAIDLLATWLGTLGVEVDRFTASMRTLERDRFYRGREVERDDVPVVAARLVGARPGPRVMLTGHVDVVPAGDEGLWSYPPFSASVEGDRLYGRGATDMKAGLVAALEVFGSFCAGSRDFAGELLFCAVPGEEDGGTGTLAAIRRGWSAEHVIIPEPTHRDGRPQLVVAHAGALTFTVAVVGRSAHACERLAGESALDHFLELYEGLRVAEAAHNQAEDNALMAALGLPYPTNVGTVRGGDWASTVMERVEAGVRVGVALGESIPEAERRFKNTVLQIAADIPWLRSYPPTVERTGAAYASASTSVDAPVVRAVRDAAREQLGVMPPVAGVPYGCDMALWREMCGADVVVFGPGDVRLAHSADEHVSLGETCRVARVLQDAAARLLSSDP